MNRSAEDMPYMNELKPKLEELLRKLTRAEADFVYAKAELADFPRNLDTSAIPPETRIALARYLYWHVPQMPIAAIAEYLLNCQIPQVAKRVGSLDLQVTCESCGDSLRAHSRGELKTAQSMIEGRNHQLDCLKPYRILCHPCRRSMIARHFGFGDGPEFT